jgi:hypothetical protein
MTTAYACAILFFSSLLSGEVAEARVFNMKDSSVAAYFRGTFGESNARDSAFYDTGGWATVFDEEVKSNVSGEMGFTLNLGESFVFRGGVEGLQTRKLVTQGTLAYTQSSLFSLTSTVLAFHPNAALEYNFSTGPASRKYVYAGAGYATVRVKNEFSYTDLGYTYYGPGERNIKETWETTALSYFAGVGWEVFILDNVTVAMDAGYRIMPTSGYTYAYSGVANENFPVAKGEDVWTVSGAKPEIDMGGYYLGITIKFYLPSMD